MAPSATDHAPVQNGIHSAPRVHVLSTHVEKPELDDRSYRLVRLFDNKLEVLLVHDPKTEKSSAAMDVHVGHLSDPKDFPGLAHALEHCLFLGTESSTRVLPANLLLGTKKYPEENDYQKYLSEHSGTSNAFTGNFHFYFKKLSARSRQHQLFLSSWL